MNAPTPLPERRCGNCGWLIELPNHAGHRREAQEAST